MSDVIEAAKSGRARCRGCGAKIDKGDLRFGEAIPNPYADEEGATTYRWYTFRAPPSGGRPGSPRP